MAPQVREPEGMGQHHHRMRACRAVVFGREHAAHRRAHPQNLKEVAGDGFGGGRLRVAAIHDGGSAAHSGGQSLQGRIAIAQVAIHGREKTDS